MLGDTADLYIGRGTYLLEFSFSDKPVVIMLGTCSPTNRMVGVELDTLTSLFLRNDLKTIVVDEHVGRTTLQLIGGNGGLDRLDRGCDDSF